MITHLKGIVMNSVTNFRIWSCPGDGPLNMPVGVLIALTEVCVKENCSLWVAQLPRWDPNCVDREKSAEKQQHPPLSVPWLWVLCEQLLQALAVSTSSPRWAVPSSEYTLPPSSCFVRAFLGSEDGPCCSHSTCLFSTWTVPFPCDLPWLASWHSSLWSFMKDLTDHCGSQSLHSVKPLPGQVSPDWDSECGVRRLPLECGNGMLLVMEVLLGVWVPKLLDYGRPLSLLYSLVTYYLD